MIRAILIDDERKCLQALSLDLQRHCPEVQILWQCGSAKEGLKSIKQLNPDLIFLDIEMPWMNGFEMLDILDDINFEVIFTTAYDEYAVQAFRISAIDYLLKPIDKDDLVEAVSKVIEKKKRTPFSRDHFDVLLNNLKPDGSNQKIAIPSSEGYDLIPVAEIIYCEADGSYTKVYLDGNRSLLVSRSIKDLGHMLQAFNFSRIHHSFLANLDHASKYVRGDGGYLVMSDGKSLTVSRAKKEQLLSRIRS